MKLVRPLFWFLIGFVALSLTTVGTARAEYMPGAEFLAKMEKMLSMAGGQDLGEFHFKEVKTGHPYRDGDVAYFSAAASNEEKPGGEIFMQLEEWRIQPDGNFIVTYIKMWPYRAVRWTINVTPGGRGLNKGGIPEETLWDIRLPAENEKSRVSPELIEKSERAQELLRDHGRPVMIGGVAI